MGSVTPLSALSPPLDQSLEHFVRRLAIVDLATAPALQHRGHGDGHLPEPIRQLLLDQPQQSPTIVSFLGSPSGEGLDDGEALAGVAFELEVAAEAFIGAAVAEGWVCRRGFETEAEPPSANLVGEHLASHGLRKNF